MYFFIPPPPTLSLSLSQTPKPFILHLHSHLNNTKRTYTDHTTTNINVPHPSRPSSSSSSLSLSLGSRPPDEISLSRSLAVMASPLPDLPALPDAALSIIFSLVSVRDLHACTCVGDIRWLTVAEGEWARRCAAKSWSAPRRPRGRLAGGGGGGASTSMGPSGGVERISTPWRALHRSRTCSGCGEGGEFPVRWFRGGSLVGLLCRRCTRAPGPRRILDEHALCLDLVGTTGKQLLTKRDFNAMRFGRKRRRSTETAAPTPDAGPSTPIVIVDQEEEEEEYAE